MSDIATTINAIRRVAAAATQYTEILVPEWLPEGKRQACEWSCRNPTRADRHAGSFSVSLLDGRWHDFATGDGGGDLVSLGAYLWNLRQIDAARIVADRLGLCLPALCKSDTMNTGQREAQRERLEAAERDVVQLRQTEQQQRQRLHKLTACRAFELLSNAERASPHHPYLTAKRLLPHGLYQSGHDLLVPLHNVRGELVNVQTIRPDGHKLFLRNGQVKFAFHVMGDFDQMIPDAPQHDVYVCEGWATGAALLQFWDIQAVVCAMNAGNLKHVALALRGRYGSGIQMVIAGDDDRTSKDNPGDRAANEAAYLAGCMVVSPEWPPGAPVELSDFNDLMIWTIENEPEA
ncbi:topoisomerase [Raoultella planticola]|uniref:toprim domain-containing protein n=1 Tax=Raoultella planticola TaxID=575 RepID=UPI000BFCC4DB|nr:toprim domain-containing protein [Raoultella planticola]ATM04487.1 topoisomerase [Raoultella planticola]ATM13355.1 topoisomerase [Raoultella planticola]PHH26700.1 topoisomerase [Raoultella planticola]HED2620931.1 toprim domain-containing protein [Raoultella planticola]